MTAVGGGRAAPGVLDALARFAAGRAALVLLGAWGFGEAIVLPIVPDVALCLLALAAPRRAAWLFGAVVAGAVLGTVVLAVAVRADPGAAASLVLAVPGVHPAMLDDARAAFGVGDLSPFAAVGPGAPLKVFTVAWLTAGGSPLVVLAGAVVNRVTRIGPVVLVAIIAGLLAPYWLRRHERPLLVAYGVAWAASYALYLA